ncbi:MAG: hypothetical protein Q8P18_07780 [Pseudomonadota bacterium]|nr:hypothetical protein [Pseudomonadota bacterium]
MIRAAVPVLLALASLGCTGAEGSGRGQLPDRDAEAPCAGWTYDVAPARWVLPAGVSTGAFTRAERGAADCVEGLPATRLFDLTGDDRPDFVMLSDCDDPAVGASMWRVWPAVAGGFGDEIPWALPADSAPGAFGVLRSAADCSGEGDLPAFRLDRLDGDELMDLVVTESCADETLADGAWRVYPSTGVGFGPGVLRPITPSYDSGSFVTPGNEESCGATENSPAWGAVDLDGDGPIDIVLTDTCDTETVGLTHWARLANDGAAFSAAEPWGIPGELAADRLSRDLGACAIGMPDYFLLDVVGDDQPDLVVPHPCAAQGSDWTVYSNEGAGFASIGAVRRAPWSLNVLVNQRERTAPDCARSFPAWVLDDADGDQDADLTITASCTDLAVGNARWDLYAYTASPGGGEGWSDAAPIALPTGYSTGSFAGGTGETPGCAGTANRPAWVRRDLDGDGKPELVVTEACADPTIGTDAWLVYEMTCAAE